MFDTVKDIGLLRCEELTI